MTSQNSDPCVIPISDNKTRKHLAAVECSAYARTNSSSWRIADDRPTVSRGLARRGYTGCTENSLPVRTRRQATNSAARTVAAGFDSLLYLARCCFVDGGFDSLLYLERCCFKMLKATRKMAQSNTKSGFCSYFVCTSTPSRSRHSSCSYVTSQTRRPNGPSGSMAAIL